MTQAEARKSRDHTATHAHRPREYTVEYALDGSGSAAYERMSWRARLGNVKDPGLSQLRQFVTRVYAMNPEAAILQAKQQRGLEALNELMNERKQDA